MRFAPALGLVVALAAVAAASAGSSSHAVPRGFRPETAAAVGTRDYWVLGDYRCGQAYCNVLVRSADAGEHFVRVDLPPLPSQGNIPSLTFASARVGYLVGRGGRLYITHDGGSSWRASGPTHVTDVALGGGDAYILLRRKNRLERSPIARSSWHAVPLPVRSRFLVPLRSADHGATFKRSPAPSFPGWPGSSCRRETAWSGRSARPG